MACYTCTGDDGTTCILGKYDIDKDDERIETMGCFDELNAVVGIVAAFASSEDTIRLLKSLQDDTHTICAEMAAAVDNMPRITENHVERIEKVIDHAERLLEPQKSFVFPGGSKEAALLHFARTVARRAERQLVRYYKSSKGEGREGVNPNLLKYINRLSSLFHIMARAENSRQNVLEEKPTYKYYNST